MVYSNVLQCLAIRSSHLRLYHYQYTAVIKIDPKKPNLSLGCKQILIEEMICRDWDIDGLQLFSYHEPTYSVVYTLIQA